MEKVDSRLLRNYEQQSCYTFVSVSFSSLISLEIIDKMPPANASVKPREWRLA